MKQAGKYWRVLITTFLFITGSSYWAQTCTVTFTPTMGPAGYVTFTATPSNTNSSSYSWNFGNATFSTAINLTNTATTYTSNGSYLATLTYTDLVTGCTATAAPSTITVTNVCNLSPNFAYAILQNGLVSFSNTSTGTLVSSTYTWNYGDNSPAVSGPFTSHTYSANNTYTVNLYVTNTANCSGTMVSFVTVTTVPACNLLPNFTHTQTGNGGVNFLSTSTGTIAGVTYSWTYGDGFSSALLSGPSMSHTYASNGTYSVNLVAYNSFTNNCQRDTTILIAVNSVTCNLNASFNYTMGAYGYVTFYSTSTGTTVNSSFQWNYGDNYSGMGVSSPHSYSYNGTYTPKLVVSNGVFCSDTTSLSINISNIVLPCALTADFTHTVGSGGQVSFNSTSAGVNGNTLYYWDFGDGVYSTFPSPTHTYASSGAYNVGLRITDGTNFSCKDSTVYSVNVTGLACMANAVFNLSPGNQPQYWNATPLYPWNVTAATWYWGDGSSSNSLYTSHIYSVAGSYNICLTVTVSCGATDSICSLSVVNRTTGSNEAQSLIYVNVTRPGVVNSINSPTGDGVDYSVFPNPNQGAFNLSVQGLGKEPVTLLVYNLTGQIIYEASVQAEQGKLNTEVNLTDLSDGIYLLKIRDGESLLTRKIVVAH